MSEPAIRVRDLSKKYQLGERGEVHDNLREYLQTSFRSLVGRKQKRLKGPREELKALNGVSFDVPPGQVVGVLGANGAGKSTLLKVLSRITDPVAARQESRAELVHCSRSEPVFTASSPDARTSI